MTTLFFLKKLTTLIKANQNHDNLKRKLD